MESYDIDKPSIVNNVTTMYISNIKEQSEHDLLEYFGKFGNIIDIKIVTDKNSGQRKGFGFIKYGDVKSFNKAISIKRHQVAGRQLYVEKSISRFNDGIGSWRGEGGCNRSWCGGNQWDTITEDHNSSNGGSDGGYGSYQMEGRHSSGGSGNECGGSVVGFNSNSSEAWQDIPQIWGNNNPARVNQDVDYSWGDLQQHGDYWDTNKSYGKGDLIEFHCTPNLRFKPYGDPGAGKVNPSNSDVVKILFDNTNT